MFLGHFIYCKIVYIFAYLSAGSVILYIWYKIRMIYSTAILNRLWYSCYFHLDMEQMYRLFTVWCCSLLSIHQWVYFERNCCGYVFFLLITQGKSDLDKYVLYILFDLVTIFYITLCCIYYICYILSYITILINSDLWIYIMAF